MGQQRWQPNLRSCEPGIRSPELCRVNTVHPTYRGSMDGQQ
jgi:hypothetical protein